MERLLDSSAVRDHVVPNTTELNEEALMLLTAGNDTTANAIIFGIYYICRHLNVQQRLATELQAQFPDIKQKIDYEGVKKLTYLVREYRTKNHEREMVAKSTLVLPPSVEMCSQ